MQSDAGKATTLLHRTYGDNDGRFHVPVQLHAVEVAVPVPVGDLRQRIERSSETKQNIHTAEPTGKVYARDIFTGTC